MNPESSISAVQRKEAKRKRRQGFKLTECVRCYKIARLARHK